MADRIVLHIGAPKAATTFLQSLWWNNRDELASAEVFLPGKVRFDHNRAAQAVRRADPGTRASRTWSRMLEEMRERSGTALVSNEWFTMASADQARTAVGQLSEAGRVEVLFTARDPASSVRAAWQEVLKLGYAVPLERFLLEMEGEEGRWSWRYLDPHEVLARWASALGPDRIHVVTAPRRSAGPNVLWERVASVIGVDPEVCDTSRAFSNSSVSVEAACLLLAIGPRLRETIVEEGRPWMAPYRWIRDEVAHDILVGIPGHPIGLRESQTEDLRARSDRTREGLSAAGFHIVGALEELDVPPQPPEAVHPDDVEPAAVLELAGTVSATLLGRLRAERERAARVERQVAARPDAEGTSTAPASSAKAGPAKAARARSLARRIKRHLRRGRLVGSR